MSQTSEKWSYDILDFVIVAFYTIMVCLVEGVKNISFFLTEFMNCGFIRHH